MNYILFSSTINRGVNSPNKYPEISLKYKITYPNYKHSAIEQRNNSLLKITPITGNLFQINDGDSVYEVNVENIINGSSRAYFNGNIFPFEIHQYYGEIFEKLTAAQQKQHKAVIKAPMPGLISKIKVETGQSIKVGESLLILEAMKMENELKSPIDGVIKHINVEIGARIDKNTILLTIEDQ